MLSTHKLISKSLFGKKSIRDQIAKPSSHQKISKYLSLKPKQTSTIFYATTDSNIIKTKNICSALDFCNQNSIYLFDFDNTLVKPENPGASDEMFEALLHTLIQNCALINMLDHAMTEKEALSTIVDIALAMQYLTRMQLVESDNTRHVINEIQNKGIPALLVTARGPAHIEITERQLEETGIDFAKGWPKETIELGMGNKEKPVIYRNGVLYCNGNDKGICTKALAEHPRFNLKIQGKIFIGVDDKYSNLDKERLMVEANGGRFFGVHYLHLKKKVERFKQSFNIEKTISKLENEVPKLTMIKEQIAIRALQAIDKLSLTVLKKKSIFTREGDKASYNSAIDTMHINLQNKIKINASKP